jgi:hypothetical protein
MGNKTPPWKTGGQHAHVDLSMIAQNSVQTAARR